MTCETKPTEQMNKKNTRIDLLFKEQNVPLYDFSSVSIELIVFDGISMKSG